MESLQLQELLDGIPVAIFRTTPAGKIIFVNQTLVDMFHYPSKEEFMKRDATSFYVNPGKRAQFKKSIAKKTTIQNYKVQMKKYSGETIWVRETAKAKFNSNNRIMYYEGVFENISEEKKEEKRRKESINELRNFIRGAIQILAQIVKSNDPYTAGHQQRVSDLSRAIATEMKLSRKNITGIRFASLIHDIGKISIPSEILTKPAKLSNIEYELVKSHVEIGYNIVKHVVFPWPIAELIHQHHERLDGSGYPRGLKGKDMLIGAKIIAVADTVEAMANHRPYRPVGIDKALDEIKKWKGIQYDEQCVNACVRLFTEKGFKFKIFELLYKKGYYLYDI